MRGRVALTRRSSSCTSASRTVMAISVTDDGGRGRWASGRARARDGIGGGVEARGERGRLEPVSHGGWFYTYWWVASPRELMHCSGSEPHGRRKDVWRQGTGEMKTAGAMSSAFDSRQAPVPWIDSSGSPISRPPGAHALNGWH